jgi:hypothetical protein
MRRTRSPYYLAPPSIPGVQRGSVPRARRPAPRPRYPDAAYWFQVYYPEAAKTGRPATARLSAPRQMTSGAQSFGMSPLTFGFILAVLVLIVAVCAISPTSTPQTPTGSQASARVVRISQLDPSQYDAPPFDVNTWWNSACSAAAMTMVLDAYGHSYRIADILRVEVALHEITVADGLLHSSGIDRTVAHFGFRATWLSLSSLDQVIATANGGTPVIINLRGPDFPSGHFQVVTGGTSTRVSVADSSRLHMTTWTRQALSRYYTGLAVVVEPNLDTGGKQ